MFSKLKQFAGQGDEAHHEEAHDQSLTTILTTHEDLTSLLLLIVEAIDVMRTQVLDTFDGAKTGCSAPLKLGSINKGDDDIMVKEELPTEQDMNQTEPHILEEGTKKMDASDAKSSDTKSGDVKGEDEDDAQKAFEKRAKKLSQPEIVELKKAALEHFDGWRDKVLQRVGEAVNQREKPEDENSRPDQAPKSSSKQQSRKDNPTPNEGDLQHFYLPQETPLRKLEVPKRVLIMHSLLLILLGLESYSAESRVLMLHLASSLDLPLEILTEDETSVAKGLLQAAKQQMNADDETKKKVDENSTARKWKVGFGAAAGAVLIGVTGGLAAPLLAAGVGTVMGGLGLGATATAGYLGALAGSAPLVGVLFGAYGGRMTGQMVDEYAKQVEDFGFMPVNKPSLIHRGKNDDKNARHLRVAICISGWLSEESEVLKPWTVISGHSTEVFALRWELKVLLNLGHAITTYIKSYAWGFAKKQILSRTIFAALSSALTLPYGLAKAARVVDNPFSVARSRSEKAGVVLADALINKVQGERPVTLIGYSLGARVIYSCLTELADRRAFGLIESVCFVGAPVPSDSMAWRRMRSVVAGRVVNVYSTQDYLLAFLYRTSSLQYGIAGLQAIKNVEGVENVDVSDLVDGHTQYRFLVGFILQKLDLEDIDAAAVEKQTTLLRREEEQIKEDSKKKEAEGKSAEEEADEMEKEVEQKNKATQAMEWMSNKMSGLKISETSSERDLTEEQKLRVAEKHEL